MTSRKTLRSRRTSGRSNLAKAPSSSGMRSIFCVPWEHRKNFFSLARNRSSGSRLRHRLPPESNNQQRQQTGQTGRHKGSLESEIRGGEAGHDRTERVSEVRPETKGRNASSGFMFRQNVGEYGGRRHAGKTRGDPEHRHQQREDRQRRRPTETQSGDGQQRERGHE